MEVNHLEQVKELIDRIADSYDLPTEEQTAEMRRLTGVAWNAEDLQTTCCEYWSHNSLEETAYMMFHGEYPPVRDVELVFWRYKLGVVLDDQAVYEKYRLGKGKLKALETLPVAEILQHINNLFHWEQADKNSSYRFTCPEQESDWAETHFQIFPYGRETDGQTEVQILCFSCHNMQDVHIDAIIACMEAFQCPLHIREESDGY